MPIRPNAPFRKLTYKQQGFVNDFVRTKNATEATALNYPNLKNREVAKQVGSENLAKPYIKLAIDEKLRENGLDIDTVIKYHKRNITQDKQLNVSQEAIKDAYKLYGHLNTNETKSSTQVAFIIER